MEPIIDSLARDLFSKLGAKTIAHSPDGCIHVKLKDDSIFVITSEELISAESYGGYSRFLKNVAERIESRNPWRWYEFYWQSLAGPGA